MTTAIPIEQPTIPPRHTCGSCPACGCWDVIITGKDISCARCGKVSKLREATGS